MTAMYGAVIATRKLLEQGGEVMKKIRKLIYNYVFKRVVAWHERRIEDQELTDALYTYDIYYEPSMCGRKLAKQFKEENRCS